jgi:hypothetical protein
MGEKTKDNYDKLISYFKYLVTISVGAITIIVSFAICFTYNNMNDLRNDALESSKESKETIKEFNAYAQRSINQTQEQTGKQITLISTEAAQLAQTAAIEKIDQTFESENINKLIENIAERKLKKKIDSIVNEKLSEANKIIDEQLIIIPDLILCTDKVGQGDRKAFEFLDSIFKSTNNQKIRKLTNEIINTKFLIMTIQLFNYCKNIK